MSEITWDDRDGFIIAEGFPIPFLDLRKLFQAIASLI